MSPRRAILIATAILLVALAGWYGWSHRRIQLYGGIKPYMQNLARLHAATAHTLRGTAQLPLDFIPMEQLSQTAQDVFGVFGNNPTARTADFAARATAQIRYGTLLEAAWDAGRTDQARQAFFNLTGNCNACHRQFTNKKIPNITNQ